MSENNGGDGLKHITINEKKFDALPDGAVLCQYRVNVKCGVSAEANNFVKVGCQLCIGLQTSAWVLEIRELLMATLGGKAKTVIMTPEQARQLGRLQ